jgi:hypothetical protein
MIDVRMIVDYYPPFGYDYYYCGFEKTTNDRFVVIVIDHAVVVRLLQWWWVWRRMLD